MDSDHKLTFLDFKRLFEAVNLKTRSYVSTANFRVISQWIQHCNTNHECISSTPAVSKYFPTRLLMIGGLSKPQLKLIDTQKTRCHGPYATLSYCWGSGVPIKLLSTSISESTLPKTLREAVMVARRIGVKYLWVDALCIIQDSLDDWNRESPKMGDVYSNSYCNIAATHTRSCDDGLFLDREPGGSGVICVEAHWDDIECRQLGLVDVGFWVEKLNKTPLNNRGWVLQERFLSPRTVHFRDDQILWECYLGRRSEHFPLGPIPGTFSCFEKRRILANQKAPEAPCSNELEPYALWGRLVKDFCSSKLTKESDKLVAISGIARKLQTEINDEYLAGLWWDQLPAQLIWGGKGVRPLQYRAPSWSWASLEGEISIPELKANLLGLIDKIEYKIEYITEDTYGQVKSGGIRLSGTLYPHILMPYRNEDWVMLFYEHDLNSKEYDKPAFLDVVEGQDYSEGEYYCLPVLFEKPTPEINSALSCLILQSTGRSQGEYSRIGTFLTNYKEDVDMLVHKSKPCEHFPGLYDLTSTTTII